MRFLKQSTATTLLLGPFVDETDGRTAETALTISQSDVLLWKEGGTTLAQKNDATSATHRSNGLYTVPVNTTDTNTLGTLVVSVAESGALPVRQDYLVVNANSYDALCATGRFGVDVLAINGSTGAAANHAVAAAEMYTGTVTYTGFSATTVAFETSSITTAAADHWNGRIVIFTSGTLKGQATRIEDYALVSGRGRFTVTAVTSAPADTVSFVIV